MGQKLFDGSMMPEYGDGAPVTPAEKGNIDIFSVGPDGEEGTDDDIGNWNMDEMK